MSGHNKWSKIKHKKAITDAKRSQSFSKVVKLIQVESRRAKGDMSDPGLLAAIEKAKKVNMPKDNIKRAVEKGVGGGGNDLESITYEAYGPGGVAMIIEALTDSRNRAAAEIRHIFSKHDLALANPGAATWAFKKEMGGTWTAQTTTKLSEDDEKKLSKLVEALEENDEVQGVFTNVKTAD